MADRLDLYSPADFEAYVDGGIMELELSIDGLGSFLRKRPKVPSQEVTIYSLGDTATPPESLALPDELLSREPVYMQTTTDKK